MELKCRKCDGRFIVRRSTQGRYFCGCQNYPKCNETMDIYDFIKAVVSDYGVKIYAWDIQCWWCKEPTKFYTYDLIYDLRKSIQRSIWERVEPDLVVGRIPELDACVAQKYPTIQDAFECYENMCEHCESPNYYQLPDDVADAFCMSRAEESFLVDTIQIKDPAVMKAIANALIAVCEEYNR